MTSQLAKWLHPAAPRSIDHAWPVASHSTSLFPSTLCDMGPSRGSVACAAAEALEHPDEFGPPALRHDKPCGGHACNLSRWATSHSAFWCSRMVVATLAGMSERSTPPAAASNQEINE